MSSAENNSEVATEKVAAEEKSTLADVKEAVKGTKRPAEDKTAESKKAKKEENGDNNEEEDEDEILEEETDHSEYDVRLGNLEDDAESDYEENECDDEEEEHEGEDDEGEQGLHLYN